MDSNSPRAHEISTSVSEPEASLEELVAYLRQKRSALREQWASRDQ